MFDGNSHAKTTKGVLYPAHESAARQQTHNHTGGSSTDILLGPCTGPLHYLRQLVDRVPICAESKNELTLLHPLCPIGFDQEKIR
jgi:hypothetical protein